MAKKRLLVSFVNGSFKDFTFDEEQKTSWIVLLNEGKSIWLNPTNINYMEEVSFE